MQTHKAMGRPALRDPARGLGDLNRSYRRMNRSAAGDAPINLAFPPHAHALSRDIPPSYSEGLVDSYSAFNRPLPHHSTADLNA
jgi:hypothetical protein